MSRKQTSAIESNTTTTTNTTGAYPLALRPRRKLLVMPRRNMVQLLAKVQERLKSRGILKGDFSVDPTLDPEDSMVVVIMEDVPREPPVEPGTPTAPTIVTTTELTALDSSVLVKEDVRIMSDAGFEELLTADVGLVKGAELAVLARAEQRTANGLDLDGRVQTALRAARGTRATRRSRQRWDIPGFNRPSDVG